MAKKVKKKVKAKARKKPAKKAAKKAVKKPAKKAARKTAKKAAVKTKPKNAAAKKPAAKRKSGLRGPDPLLTWRIPKPGETLVGIVDDFYSHIGVITLTLRAPLNVGDNIHVRGHTTDLEQAVGSMQCEHKDVENGKTGMGVGIKINDKARRGDYIYKIPEE